MKKLVAVVHGESQVEYDRSRQLPEKQLEYLEDDLNSWMGETEQTDDITVMGIRF